jgi:titin
MAPILSLVSIGNNSVNLSWINDPSANISNSFIFYTDNPTDPPLPGSESSIFKIDLTSVEAESGLRTITNLVNGTNYLFTYVQTQSTISGAQFISNTVSSMPSTVPTAPTMLSGDTDIISINTSLIVNVQFNDNGSNPLTSIEFIIVGNQTITTQIFDLSGQTLGNTQQFTLINLVNFTEYEVACYTYNTNGTSLISNTVSSIPATTPNPPLNLTAVPGYQQITLSWEPPTDAVYVPILSYNVVNALTTQIVANVTGSTLTYTVPNLTPGVTYIFYIEAINIYGTGLPSTTVVSIPYQASTAVLNLSSDPSNNSVLLSWDPPSNTGGFPVSSYVVYLATSPVNIVVADLSSNITSYLITGLTNGNSYTYSVVPFTYNPVSNQYIPGVFSSVTTKPYTFPGPPQNLVATPGDNSMILTWSAPTSANTGGYPISIYVINTYDMSNTLLFTENSLTPYTQYGLINGTSYIFQVVSQTFNTELNQTITGESISVISVPFTQSQGVQNFQASPSDGVVSLSWEPPLDTGGSPVTGYNLYIDNATSPVSLPPNNTSYGHTGLTNGEPHSYRMVAVTTEPGSGTPGEGESNTIVANSYGLPIIQLVVINNKTVTTTINNNGSPLNTNLTLVTSDNFQPGDQLYQEYGFTGSEINPLTITQTFAVTGPIITAIPVFANQAGLSFEIMPPQ